MAARIERSNPTPAYPAHLLATPAALRRQREVDAAWEGRAWHPLGGTKWGHERRRLAEAQNWRCCWCFKPMDVADRPASRATLDHIVPTSLGGPDELVNIAIACLLCNSTRPSDMGELLRLQRLFRSHA